MPRCRHCTRTVVVFVKVAAKVGALQSRVCVVAKCSFSGNALGREAADHGIAGRLVGGQNQNRPKPSGYRGGQEGVATPAAAPRSAAYRSFLRNARRKRAMHSTGAEIA
ncbi:hypothetical protein HPB50_004189 [Hyalomma asiaticum]|uniref:Uncharacterized protein n=1 Tax=Hyalomma asiaticum TaxID=266040 RepID=A0ACB7SSW6_HYAAI|nr:hypothetical protein HPB50_004189 [Hyalomma asiaticum]